MSKPGTPLPWHISKRCQSTVIDDIDDVLSTTPVACCHKDIGLTRNAAKDAAYIVEACNNFPEAIKLLRDIHAAVDGWEIWPTIDETINSIDVFLYMHDPEWTGDDPKDADFGPQD